MAQINRNMLEMNDNEIYVEMKHGADPGRNPETIKNKASRASACVPAWWIVTSVVSLAVFGTIVTVLAVYQSHTCPACPVHWMSYNSTCYYLSRAEKNWTASWDSCAAERSQLLVISDFWELDFLQRNIKGSYWIGLRKPNATSDWFWEGDSGIVPKVTANSVIQECGVMLDGRIRASSCSVPLPWICKKHLS